MKVLKIKTLILAIFLLPGVLLAQLPEETVFGKLKYMQAENGNVFLAIDTSKRLVAEGSDGKSYSSKILQLVITNATNGAAAMELVGETVSATGALMVAHTVHHHTEVLLVTDKVVKNEENSQDEGE
jgi:hypothetical protein